MSTLKARLTTRHNKVVNTKKELSVFLGLKAGDFDKEICVLSWLRHKMSQSKEPGSAWGSGNGYLLYLVEEYVLHRESGADDALATALWGHLSDSITPYTEIKAVYDQISGKADKTDKAKLVMLCKEISKMTILPADLMPDIDLDSVIAHVSVAIMKRGTITSGLCDRLNRQFQEEGVLRNNLLITQATCKQMYDIYADSMIREDVHTTLHESTSSSFSVRMNLCWSRISTTNFTAYRAIKKAKENCPQFPWDELSLLYASESEAIAALERCIERDAMFGFSADANNHGVNKYPVHFLVAKGLITQVLGDRNFSVYNGDVEMADRSRVDLMVREYQMKHNAVQTKAIDSILSKIKEL